MFSSAMPYLGQLEPKRTALMVCDLQEKFAPSILHFDNIVDNAARLIKAAKILEMPILATEQYPQGLGNTVDQLRSHLNPYEIVSKTKFTMMVPEIVSKLDKLRELEDVGTVLLCGIETHVCVIATCQDLIKKGFNVHIVADACSSRTQTDRHFALDRMRQIGAFVNTTESVVLSLAGDSKHPKFKELQSIIRVLNPDTELVKSSL